SGDLREDHQRGEQSQDRPDGASVRLLTGTASASTSCAGKLALSGAGFPALSFWRSSPVGCHRSGSAASALTRYCAAAFFTRRISNSLGHFFPVMNKRSPWAS